MPDLPPPEELSAEEYSRTQSFCETQEFTRRYLGSSCAGCRNRDVDPKIDDSRIHMWIKAIAKMPGHPTLHLCALAALMPSWTSEMVAEAPRLTACNMVCREASCAHMASLTHRRRQLLRR